MPVKRTILFICIVLSILGIFTYSASQNKNVPYLKAERGEIIVDCGDLIDSPYLLTGEWRVYSGLYSPSQLDAQPYTFAEDLRYIYKLAGATYTLDLYATDLVGYYIMMPEPNGCRLWINGKEVTADNNERNMYDATFALYDGDHAPQKIQIVFQVSTSGGTQYYYQGLILGTANQLNKVQEDCLVNSIISIGIMAMLIINAMTLFVHKRSEDYLLLLAAAAFLAFISTLNTTPYIRYNWSIVAINLPDHLRPVLSEYLGVIRMFLRVTILMKLFPKALPQKIMAVFQGGAPLFLILLACFFCLPSVPELGNILTVLLTWIFMFMEGWIIVHGFFHKHTGSTVLLIGFGIYLGCRILLILVSLGVIPHHAFFLPFVQNLGNIHLLYWITISAAINGRFAQKYHQADYLTANLEQKVIEKTAAIQASQDKIILMQRQKREFNTGMMHNLNSALFTLGGYIEILKDEIHLESLEARRYLDRIEAKVDYVKKMAADIFLMEKLDDGHIRMDNNCFDLAALCRQIIHDATLLDEGKNLTFNMECQAKTAYFSGDRFYLQQAIENILSNAIRNSNQNGSISISITVENDMYYLAISDNGEGISSQDLPHIFERYYTKKKVGCTTTGLGLSIALEIVRQHGGTISVESSLGEGAIFTIQLLIPRELQESFDLSNASSQKNIG